MNRLKNYINSFTVSERFNIALIKLFVIAVIFMAVFQLDITIQANGRVIPQGNITSVDSMVTGQIEAVNFKEGDTVKKDEVIVVLNPGVGYEKYNVKAPVDGKIQNLYYKNPGGVIKQGQNVVIIVPTNSENIVEAKLMLKDRGYVQTGQTVSVKLNNADAMLYGPIQGVIESVSPDAVQSQQGNYFLVRIKLNKQRFESGSSTYELYPGIDVQAYILTGKRSVLNYLLTPISNGLNSALQEK